MHPGYISHGRSNKKKAKLSIFKYFYNVYDKDLVKHYENLWNSKEFIHLWIFVGQFKFCILTYITV